MAEPPIAEAAAQKYVLAHWLPSVGQYTPGEGYPDILRDDVRAAMEAGIDGFEISVVNGYLADLMFAEFSAQAGKLGASGFRFALQPDMTLGFPAADIVAVVRKWASSPYYLKVNGKPVLFTWGGQDYGDAWWQANVLAPLALSGIEVEFIPYFNVGDPDLSLASRYPSADGFHTWFFQAGVPFYASDPAYGLYNSYSNLEQAELMADRLRSQGKSHAPAVLPYYWASCSSVRQYYEYQGGRGVDSQWTSIITRQQPDIVKLVTWNDWNESSYFQPTRITKPGSGRIMSFAHLGYYELNKYFISWFKNGRRPIITRDTVFYFHRTQRNAAVASNDAAYCSLPILPYKIRGATEDAIFVTTALTTPAELRVTTAGAIKSYPVPAGLAHTNVPFNPGEQLVEIWRDGVRVAGSSGTSIEANPVYHNYGLSSGYDVAGGSASSGWLPSDKWKTGYVADWFAP